ncbi:hypothetical protein KEM09_04335 [Carboxylicivirga mesophila]|uniref:DUF4476 domain-containing protein n=1 Tax=Carboxylicivirga mesophila TaxID=1166478 RepID=A0ABS5K6L0_9BACT|nr:hypothetical protein [Carboxylicivirga mesophila]MBS2210615.1 hypothetical protein [Carboxylicivirga mesophila]
MKKICLLVVFFSCVSALSAQTRQVWLHGKVMTQGDKRNIPLAQVASFKKMNVFAADSAGEFKVILDANDSIKVFALGFEARTFYLDSLHIDPDLMYLFPLKATSYQIQQVDVNSNKHYMDYQDKLKMMRSKQMEMDLVLPADIELGRQPDVPVDILPTYRRNPPVLAAFLQPANVIYYYTSKTEKQKRKMMKLLKYEKQRQMMTIEMLSEVSGYKGTELDEFIMYCNEHIKFSEMDTPLSIKYKVVDLLEEYKKDE